MRASEAAIERLGIKFSDDEQLVCVTENDACGVDGVQAILSCTVGKGNLLFHSTGKMAFHFFNRATGDNLRVCMKPLDKEMSREERIEYILSAPLEEVFSLSKSDYVLPERARLFQTVVCEKCGEGAPEHKMRLVDGKKVCLDCFKDYNRGW